MMSLSIETPLVASRYQHLIDLSYTLGGRASVAPGVASAAQGHRTAPRTHPSPWQGSCSLFVNDAGPMPSYAPGNT